MTSSRPPEVLVSVKVPRRAAYLRMSLSYFGGDGIAEEWWSTINQPSPRFT